MSTVDSVDRSIFAMVDIDIGIDDSQQLVDTHCMEQGHMEQLVELELPNHHRLLVRRQRRPNR